MLGNKIVTKERLLLFFMILLRGAQTEPNRIRKVITFGEIGFKESSDGVLLLTGKIAASLV